MLIMYIIDISHIIFKITINNRLFQVCKTHGVAESGLLKGRIQCKKGYEKISFRAFQGSWQLPTTLRPSGSLSLIHISEPTRQYS